MSLAAGAFAVVVGLLSIPVVVNLLSSEQQMNASFAPLHLVNRTTSSRASRATSCDDRGIVNP